MTFFSFRKHNDLFKLIIFPLLLPALFLMFFFSCLLYLLPPLFIMSSLFRTSITFLIFLSFFHFFSLPLFSILFYPPPLLFLSPPHVLSIYLTKKDRHTSNPGFIALSSEQIKRYTCLQNGYMSSKCPLGV